VAKPAVRLGAGTEVVGTWPDDTAQDAWSQCAGGRSGRALDGAAGRHGYLIRRLSQVVDPGSRVPHGPSADDVLGYVARAVQPASDTRVLSRPGGSRQGSTWRHVRGSHGGRSARSERSDRNRDP